MGAMQKSIHTPEYQALCRQLSEIRREAGLSQRALASRLKVTPSWVAKVETGERRIDLIEFVRFVEASEADALELFARVANEARIRGSRSVKKRRRK
jgi:transcriptional regulator with XRE-family HTH domain